jgi:hypothetical protein
MIAADGKVNFTLPSCIPDGDYLLRHEVIALHSASSYPGAQFYMECAQITVTGGGSATPETYAIPGIYAGTDPGITINIYYPAITNFTIPGPALFTCDGSSSTSIFASSVVASSSAVPSTSAEATSSSPVTALDASTTFPLQPVKTSTSAPATSTTAAQFMPTDEEDDGTCDFEPEEPTAPPSPSAAYEERESLFNPPKNSNLRRAPAPQGFEGFGEAHGTGVAHGTGRPHGASVPHGTGRPHGTGFLGGHTQPTGVFDKTFAFGTGHPHGTGRPHGTEFPGGHEGHGHAKLTGVFARAFDTGRPHSTRRPHGTGFPGFLGEHRHTHPTGGNAQPTGAFDKAFAFGTGRPHGTSVPHGTGHHGEHRGYDYYGDCFVRHQLPHQNCKALTLNRTFAAFKSPLNNLVKFSHALTS